MAPTWAGPGLFTFSSSFSKRSLISYLKWTVRSENKEGDDLNIAVDGLDTLQAAQPPRSVSNGPVKINLETSASGGLIYEIKD